MPRWAESGIGRLMLRRTCMGSSPKLGGSWSGCGTRTSDCGVAWVCHRPMRWPSPSWTNPRSGKAGYAPAVTGGWNGRSTTGRPKRHLPLTDEVVAEHLQGSKTIGVYPLRKDDTCWFLACDFDGGSWALDAAAFVEVCGRHDVPALLERSRSGEGGHVWIFFTAPVLASLARQMGFGLLRETMLLRAELDLASYDRFFPSQDVLPKGSFGNLIALPLQGTSVQAGNTLFCDPATLRPWPDQWLKNRS